jgi:crotonobetainyl-CoA:carnitine CoA-transferase CaiB-like acyl-CoA transferase
MTSGGPLHGFRVLDLADEMGALAGKMFADMGADVIKVEPLDGCPTRRIPPFLDDVPGPDRSAYFLSLAAGKRSVTLDLEQDRGRELLARLAEGADFLIESFPAGFLGRRGLDYEALKARNPRLVYTSVTPFGDRGPAANWRATDIVGWAASGMMTLMGSPGRPPLQVTVPQACFFAGAEAGVGSMLAHLDRERSGQGQHVVISMQAAAAGALNTELAFPVLEERSMARAGETPAFMPRAGKYLYKCADGHVQLTVGPGLFLATVIGVLEWARELGPLPEQVASIDFATWTRDRQFSQDQAMIDEVVACENAIQDQLSRFTKAEIMHRADRKGWAIAPVNTPEDIAHDPQLAFRDYYQQVEHPALDRSLTLIGPFAKLSGSPAPPTRRAPMLGEHTVEILQGELKLSGDELAALEAAGVIGTAAQGSVGQGSMGQGSMGQGSIGQGSIGQGVGR